MELKQRIKEEIKSLSDEEYRKFHKSLCPGTQNIIGVRVPKLRNYAKELNSKYSLSDLLNNIDNEFYEEIMLQGMLIGLNKNEDIDLILRYVEKFIPNIDNWAVCDTFCAGLKITYKTKERIWNFIQKYLKSDKEFEIRFGFVMILDYYIEEQYLEDIFEIFDEIKNEEYYVKMAKAWAISVSLVKYYKKTKQYLEIAKIDNWTYNKAIQKAIESYRITEEQKNELRGMKRNINLLK